MRTKALCRILLCFALLCSGFSALAAEEEATALLQQAVTAAQKGDFPQAITLTTRAIKREPKQKQGWLLRAACYDRQGEYAKAVRDYSEVLKRDPKDAAVWQRRGETNFRAGKIAASLTDFDACLRLTPDQKPYHWQRGIALYYAGRFADGKQQFELHQTVNTQDVENAVWHFLCTARLKGVEAAKQQLIPIEKDARVPMAQVHQLFAGKASPEDVLNAARAASPNVQTSEPLFYAHLYLGLYYEALGDAKQARDYIFKAAAEAKANGYMGDVARVHAAILRKAKEKRESKK